MNGKAAVGLLLLLGGGVCILFAATTVLTPCETSTGAATTCLAGTFGVLRALLFGGIGVLLAAGGTRWLLDGLRDDGSR